MKNSNKIYFYIAANLAFLIPVPGRFAYAVIMLVLFNIQMATITLLFHAVHHMQLAEMRNAILSLTIVGLAIFYKQLLALYCPDAALTLGYCIFLPTLASVVIDFFFLDYKKGLKQHLTSNMIKSGTMTLFSLVFFLFRDIVGYGTLTLPSWKHITVLHVPYNPESTGASVFLATIPGSLVLISVLLALYIFFSKKFSVFGHSTFKNGGEIEHA